jgi:exoribonuclease R
MYLQSKRYEDFCLIEEDGSVAYRFEGAEKANKALPGDQVLWTNQQCQIVQRASYGWIVGTLELNSKYLYGHTSRGVPIYIFQPMNTAFPVFRVGCSLKDTNRNQIVLIEFSEWPTHEKFPRGNLLKVLGKVGDNSAEKLGIQWLYGYPRLTGKNFLFTGPHDTEVRPFVEGVTINIDPPGCKDIDDVVTLRSLPGKSHLWECVITIADVAAWIPDEGEADRQALIKTQTLYENGHVVIPMLPLTLSEDNASLHPGQERLGVSLFCEWDGTQLHRKGFQITRVRNQKSYTYDSIYEAEKTFAFPVGILREIASYLLGQPTDDSHVWIEQLMLLYNKEAALVLLETKTGLLRAHDAPDKEKAEQLEKLHPDLRFLAYTSAKYVPTADGWTHAGLGNTPYAHASSPLRRYADLMNQRALKAAIRCQECSPCSTSLALKLNKGDKRHRQYDRDLFFLEQVGQASLGCKTGLVVSANEKKVSVYIPTWKRMVRVKHQEQLEPGTQVVVEYYANMNKPRWKERFVMRLRVLNM